MIRYGLTILALCLGMNAPAAAATLKGTATNGTTGLPAVGDQVMLMAAPAAGGALTEIGRGKTDASGRFQFTVADTRAPHLVRVIHQGVAYQHVAPAGVGSVEVPVYDAAQELDGVTATQDVQRLQTAGDRLQVIEEISVRNASDPPRTLNHPFEIQLPPEAQVLAGRMRSGDRQPVESKPTPGGQKGRYYFPFPLLPGDSRFGVAYLLPYQGEAVIDPKILYPLGHFLVVLPKSMKFEAKTPGVFQSMPDKAGSNVQEMAAVKPDQPLAFRVSGTGTLVAAKAGQKPVLGGQTARTGGRMGPPAELRDSVRTFRWFFLGGFALVLAAGVAGLMAHKRKHPQGLAARGGSATRVLFAPGRLQ